MRSFRENEKLVIPKSDLQAGPGLIPLKDLLDDLQDPLSAFNEGDE